MTSKIERLILGCLDAEHDMYYAMLCSNFHSSLSWPFVQYWESLVGGSHAVKLSEMQTDQAQKRAQIRARTTPNHTANLAQPVLGSIHTSDSESRLIFHHLRRITTRISHFFNARNFKCAECCIICENVAFFRLSCSMLR